MSRTLGQQRAAFCLVELADIRCDRSEFKPLTAGLPAMVLQNGFGQTLAFLVAKGSEVERKTQNIVLKPKDKHIAAFRIIVSWLVQRNLLQNGKPAEVLKRISEMTQPQYLQAQKETLAMLEWLKRYANAGLFEE